MDKYCTDEVSPLPQSTQHHFHTLFKLTKSQDPDFCWFFSPSFMQHLTESFFQALSSAPPKALTPDLKMLGKKGAKYVPPRLLPESHTATQHAA